jgi:acyl dehydratase
VRFTAPVPCGSRIRLVETLKDATQVDTGMRLTFECVIEVEGSARPAMVAETLVLIAKD